MGHLVESDTAAGGHPARTFRTGGSGGGSSAFGATAVLHVLFLISGAAALIYEVVWTRWLTGLLGSASAATSIVLAVFMGGLGIGSWLAARFADRLARPIRTFALVELAVVALVLAPLWEVQQMEGLLRHLASWYGPVSPVLDLARVVASVIAIGPAAILMGVGLPLIVKKLAPSEELLGRRMATAYAANSLGGVCGTLLAGFFLIETLGLRATCLTAGILGAMVGTIALWLDRYSEPLRQVEVVRRASTNAGFNPRTARARLGPTWILAAAAVSGFCGLGYEVIWYRVLSVLTLNTTYAFSLMLAILLFGLSLGSWLVRGRLDRMRDPAAWFVVLQILLSLYAISSLLWAPASVELAKWIVPVGAQGLLTPWFGRPLVMSVCLLLVPATLMGSSLPTACKLYGSLTGGVGRPAGRTFAANTFGSILGSIVVGLLVIPSFGTWWALALCAVAGAAAAGGVAWFYGVPRQRPIYGAAAAGTVLVAVVMGITHGGTAVTQKGLGQDDTVCFRAEDGYGLVEVTEDKQMGIRAMLTNRLHREGSTLPRAVAEQRKQGLLPLLLHGSPRRVMEIGLGTGIKLCALESPAVQEVVVVEISPAVIEASCFFADYNHSTTSMSRAGRSKVRIVCADGRNYLALTPKRFDLIVNGLLTPYRAGVSRLYTLEHFRSCRDKLAPDGMFVVWVAIRQISPDDLKVLTRTLLEVFPYTTMWLDGYYLAFVSHQARTGLDIDQILRRSESDLSGLAEAGLDSPLALLATFVAGPQTLGGFASGQPLNTEDKPIIEFRTPRLGDQLNASALAAEILGTLSLLQEPIWATVATATGKTRDRLRQAQEARWAARQGLIAKCYGRHVEAARLFQQALAKDRSDSLAQYEMEIYLVAHGKHCLERGLLVQAHHTFQQAVRVNPRSIGALACLAAMEETAGHRAEAATLRQRALALDPHNGTLRDRIGSTNRSNTSGRY